MAFTKTIPSTVNDVRPYLEGVAKNLADRIWGPKGPAWGTKLTELEDLVVALRAVLSEQMLHQALQRQAADAAARPPDCRACPGCGGGTAGHDPEPRNVDTRGGEARWHEPQEYCTRCRRAFFPSVQEPGD
jgi:hypothetical protein